MATTSIKIKRPTTDLLNDKARARIVENFSSGSDHSAAADVDSPCLSHLLHDFLENQDTGKRVAESDSDDGGDESDEKDVAEDIIKRMIIKIIDPFRNLLLLHVLKAISLHYTENIDKSIFRRNVMAFLRSLGHNAAICKAKWENHGGLTGGNYEYIDVIRSGSNGVRYFVDLDFAGEFKIARPTEQYSRLLRLVPVIYVGKGEELKVIVKATSYAMKRSLKTRGLSFPPWRKNRYMQTKWFGEYRRTVNVIPANTPVPVAAKCRRLGFDEVDDDGHLMIPEVIN
ncbi:uncharacterized protein LOC124912986 [Impatiens glandulifera]|uniref:uncharacterized protein LOC124912986 n=1 Tax=Impatiens glandulifera TaxID=253017 RepID=UPI001FB0557F|nr:uncharacterized protein LOC124912986 [Impatiens glandulifera]